MNKRLFWPLALLLSLSACSVDDGDEPPWLISDGSTEPSFVLNEEKSHLFIGKGNELQIINIESISNLNKEGSMIMAENISDLQLEGKWLAIRQQQQLEVMDVSDPLFPKAQYLFSEINRCNGFALRNEVLVYITNTESECQDELNLMVGTDLQFFSDRPAYTYEDVVESPNDLQFDSDFLFLADGKAGLKVFDAIDAESFLIFVLDHQENAYRIFVKDKKIILLTDQALKQYELVGQDILNELSTIPIIE